jgi:hypothetical protein
MEEIERAAQTDIVKRIVRLLHLRNECSAFDGRFFVRDIRDSRMELSWENGGASVSLELDLRTREAIVTQRSEGSGMHRWKA